MSLPNQIVMPADGAPNPFTIPGTSRTYRCSAGSSISVVGDDAIILRNAGWVSRERRRHRRLRRDLRPAGQRPHRTGLQRHDDRRPRHLRRAEGRLAASQHRRLGLSIAGRGRPFSAQAGTEGRRATARRMRRASAALSGEPRSPSSGLRPPLPASGAIGRDQCPTGHFTN